MTSAAVDLVDAAADGFHDGTVPMVAAVVEWAKDGWTVTTSVQVARLLLLCSWPWLLFILIGDAWWTDKGRKRVETAAIKVTKRTIIIIETTSIEHSVALNGTTLVEYLR